MPDAISSLAIQWLSGYLSRFYEKRVIILLDEYDTPLQESYVNEYWEELSGLVRNLLNATFKTNPYLERGILTGITRVSREGSAAIKSDFEALMKGQELEKKIDEQLHGCIHL